MTPDCPACGFANDVGATECGRCHLAADLFGPVRDAIGDAGADPHYVRLVNEMLSAVDDGSVPEGTGSGPVSARLMNPLRFPSIDPPQDRAGPPDPVRGLETLPALPALPAGAGFELYRRQVDDYLQLARRQGIDLAEFSDRAKRAILVQDRESVEVLGRELFVFLASSLAEEFDAVCGIRNELAALVPTTTPDTELEACRQSLVIGDLGGAQRRLHRVAQSLGDLEEHWETVQILLTESDLIAETVRELGGDPTPALGPLEEGRRLAREGQREAAEPLLARTIHALWAILTPLFQRELHRSRDVLLKGRPGDPQVAASVTAMRELAEHLRRRNFASAVTSFRRLRAAVDAVAAAGPVPPVAEGPADPASPPAAS